MKIEKDKKYIIKSGEYTGQTIRVEGLWKEITGKSWMFSEGNPAAIMYAIRSVKDEIPLDDHVYYGKIGDLGYLVHESEISVGVGE